MKYWIKYIDETVDHFDADSDDDAHHYFMMEGDHAYDYGPVRLCPPTLTGAASGWMVVDEDPYEGQVPHRTRKGKGAVGQAIAKHKNCK